MITRTIRFGASRPRDLATTLPEWSLKPLPPCSATTHFSGLSCTARVWGAEFERVKLKAAAGRYLGFRQLLENISLTCACPHNRRFEPKLTAHQRELAPPVFSMLAQGSLATFRAVDRSAPCWSRRRGKMGTAISGGMG
jgi:hypothetical protein